MTGLWPWSPLIFVFPSLFSHQLNSCKEGQEKRSHQCHSSSARRNFLIMSKTCKTSPDFTKNEDLTTHPEMSYLTSSVVPGRPTLFVYLKPAIGCHPVLIQWLSFLNIHFENPPPMFSCFWNPIEFWINSTFTIIWIFYYQGPQPHIFPEKKTK